MHTAACGEMSVLPSVWQPAVLCVAAARLATSAMAVKQVSEPDALPVARRCRQVAAGEPRARVRKRGRGRAHAGRVCRSAGRCEQARSAIRASACCRAAACKLLLPHKHLVCVPDCVCFGSGPPCESGRQEGPATSPQYRVFITAHRGQKAWLAASCSRAFGAPPCGCCQHNTGATACPIAPVGSNKDALCVEASCAVALCE